MKETNMEKSVKEIIEKSPKFFKGLSELEYKEKVMGFRPEGMAFDLPIEIGFKCPVCDLWSEGLDFSEFKGMLWCPECKLDIPSCLCKMGQGFAGGDSKGITKRQQVELQTEIFLQCVEDAKK